MYYLVYKITNNVNGKIYIGAHKTKDKNDGYLGSGNVIIRAVRKYGIEHFTKEILYECNSLDEMYKREADIVDKEFALRRDTYNLKVGGTGGWENSLTISHREKISISMKKAIKEGRAKVPFKGEKLPRWLIEKQIEARRGFKHTEESKRKIGKANSIHQQGSGNSNYGTSWIYSLEEKKSIRIKKEELNEYLEKGWIKGRVIKNFEICPICKVGRLKRSGAKYCSVKCSGESRIVDRLSIEDLKKLIKMYK